MLGAGHRRGLAWVRTGAQGVLALGVGAGVCAAGEVRGRQGTDARQALASGQQGAAGAGRRGRARRTAWASWARDLGVPGRACVRRLGVLTCQLGQVGAQCTWLSSDSVFLDPVRLGIFSESLNEHCSL